MLDTLANSGAEIDDTPMILLAQEAMRTITTAVEQGIDQATSPWTRSMTVTIS